MENSPHSRAPIYFVSVFLVIGIIEIKQCIYTSVLLLEVPEVTFDSFLTVMMAYLLY